MTSDKRSYMKACLAAFREVSQAKYGTPFDLDAVERSVERLRSRKTLTYQELRSFEAREHWWFERYWALPPEERIAPALEKRTFNFWNLPTKEAPLITGLLDVFKSIELVSIILRFVRPEHYGIISPPVERVLDVRRGSDAVETYQNYLGDLRAIRDYYGFKRTADADMALWVLHERCFGELRDPAVQQTYLADPFMLELRAKNLVAPLTELSYARLAAALREPAPELAALIACYTMELLIRQIATLLGVAGPSSSVKLDAVIGSLPNFAGIDQVRKARWQRLRAIRNELVHDGRQPTAKGLADLLDEVLNIEETVRRLQASQGARRA